MNFPHRTHQKGSGRECRLRSSCSFFCSFFFLGLYLCIAPNVAIAAGETEKIPSITHSDGGTYSYTTGAAGDSVNIGSNGTNSIDLRNNSTANIITSSANGVNGDVILDGGILLGPNSNQSFPGFLTVNAAGNFSSVRGLQANTNSGATITASSVSFGEVVNVTRRSNLTLNGATSITSGTAGLYSGLGGGITVNGNLTINSVDGALSVGGGDAGFITVNGTSYIHSSNNMGVSVFQDNTATFNGYAHVVSDTNYGVYIQGSNNQPEALARFSDVLIESGKQGILLQFDGSAVEATGSAEIRSGAEGVYSTSGRGYFNDLKIISQGAGIYSNNRNTATASSTVVVGGIADITASRYAGALAYQGGTITFNNGVVRGTGDNVHGLQALQNGQITTNGDMAVTTDGSAAYGMYAVSNGRISNAGNTSVNTSGDGSYGIYATDNGVVSNSGTLNVSTITNGTYGVYADTGGQVTTDGTINVQTSGQGAVGVYVADGGSVFSNGELNVQTTGENAHGLYVDTGATIGSTGRIRLTTTGTEAHGIYLDQGNTVDVGGTVAIQTTDGQSYGVFADNASNLTLHGGSIEVADGSFAAFGNNGSALILAPGAYAIKGDMLADNGAGIDAQFINGSSFVGTTSMIDPASTINVTMNDSIWQLTGFSRLTGLTANTGSYINLTNKAFDCASGSFTGTAWLPFGNQLTVNNLGGNGGTFLMHTDIANEAATQMRITDTSSGAHKLYVFNDGGAQTTGNERVDLVYDGAAARSGTFSLTHTVELGGWQYDLEERTDPDTGETVWYLKGGSPTTTPPPVTPPPVIPPPVTPPSPDPSPSATGSNITNIYRASRYLSIAETNTLMQRMGDLRAGADSNEVWVRTYGGRINVEEGDYARNFSMTYGGAQAGGDRKVRISPKGDHWGDLYLGVMAGYTYGDLDFKKSGNGSVDSKTVGAYATVAGDNGFYADAIFKGMWLHSELNGRDSAGDRVKGDTDRFGAGVSLEVGKRMDMADLDPGTIYLEPQAQVSYTWYGSDTMKASNGLRMKLDEYQEGIARVGLQAGINGETEGGTKFNVYGKVSYNHSFGDDLSITINDVSRVKETLDDRWISAGVGVTANLGENHNLYLEYEYAKGNTFQQPWGITAGWRVTF